MMLRWVYFYGDKPMNTNIISDFVGEQIKELFAVSDESYSPNLDIYVCYGADQLDMVEICMAIEEEFGIEMPDIDYGTAKDFIDAAAAA